MLRPTAIPLACQGIMRLAADLNVQNRIIGQIRKNCCSSMGVSCNADGNVIIIKWQHMNLRGRIDSAALPSTLTELYLSENKISGEFPKQLPPRLKRLNLSSNVLSGPIPNTLPSTLRFLDISENQFTGTLNMIAAHELNIRGNQFNGLFIEDINDLYACDCSNNHLKGVMIPAICIANNLSLPRLVLSTPVDPLSDPIAAHTPPKGQTRVKPAPKRPVPSPSISPTTKKSNFDLQVSATARSYILVVLLGFLILSFILLYISRFKSSKKSKSLPAKPYNTPAGRKSYTSTAVTSEYSEYELEWSDVDEMDAFYKCKKSSVENGDLSVSSSSNSLSPSYTSIYDVNGTSILSSRYTGSFYNFATKVKSLYSVDSKLNVI